jgi:hypothetical protein
MDIQARVIDKSNNSLCLNVEYLRDPHYHIYSVTAKDDKVFIEKLDTHEKECLDDCIKRIEFEDLAYILNKDHKIFLTKKKNSRKFIDYSTSKIVDTFPYIIIYFESGEHIKDILIGDKVYLGRCHWYIYKEPHMSIAFKS